MRKLTAEERAAKKAGQTAQVVAPVKEKKKEKEGSNPIGISPDSFRIPVSAPVEKEATKSDAAAETKKVKKVADSESAS